MSVAGGAGPKVATMSTDRVAVPDLDVERVGSGPAVLFVHGSIADARRTWRRQRDLGDRWSLCLPNRPGFGGSRPLARGDFAVEAPLVAELLGDGAHLVGHSYGAVIALVAAGLRPSAVWSLTVSEPGLLRLAAGDAAVDALIERSEELYRTGDTLAPREFLRRFRAGVNDTQPMPDALPPWLEHGVRLAARERPPWEAEIPFGLLRRAGFPKLVVSGGHSRVFEVICDVLAQRVGAERRVIRGRGHEIAAVGEPYNSLLSEFLRRAEAAHGTSANDT